jgi:hypothetical protein
MVIPKNITVSVMGQYWEVLYCELYDGGILSSIVRLIEMCPDIKKIRFTVDDGTEYLVKRK